VSVVRSTSGPNRSISVGIGTSGPTLRSAPQSISADQACRFRQRATGSSKAPLPQHGEAHDSLDPDIDCPPVLLDVRRQARRHLPPDAPIRRRAGSPRHSMSYRAPTAGSKKGGAL
jgi:hypothetical protein